MSRTTHKLIIDREVIDCYNKLSISMFRSLPDNHLPPTHKYFNNGQALSFEQRLIVNHEWRLVSSNYSFYGFVNEMFGSDFVNCSLEK